MSKHAIIGANIMDRLIKCPGSLKCGNGSLDDYYKSTKGKTRSYTKNRIECNAATTFGMKVDEYSKNLLRWKFGLPEKRKYTNSDDDLGQSDEQKLLRQCGEDYCRHMEALRKRFGKCSLDPAYDMSRYMPSIDNVEFRVTFNPDFVAINEDGTYRGTVYVSDLTTGRSYDRNKMFQVLCCAVGIITTHKECNACICEVYNPVTKEVMISKFYREELEAWRDEVIVPALYRVREALSDRKENIENHRAYNSWCDSFCIYASEGCCACHSNKEKVENDVPIQLNFFYNNMNEKDKEQYAALFK